MSKFAGLGGRLYRGETSIDFIGLRRRWYAFSGLLIVASAIGLVSNGLQLGIEFKGGSSYTVQMEGVTVAQAQDALDVAKVPGEPIVQKIGSNKVRIQTGALTTEESNRVQDALAAEFNISLNDIDSQIVGPSWGKEITRKAVYALIGFLLLVMLYLAMAFEPKMALSAVAAVVHDVFITVGIYSLVGFDVTPATVIGFLTILGYSLYDTVVVFDMIRQNTRTITSTSKMTFSQAANLGVNQTVVRSINTSIVALLPVASILFVGAGLLGAGTLKDLSLALFIGLAVGTYSSIFIAPQILATLREREPAMKALAKRVALRGAVPVATPVLTTGAESPVAIALKPVTKGPRNQPKRKGRR